MNTLSCLGASPLGDDISNSYLRQADYPNMPPQTQESANAMKYSVRRCRFLSASYMSVMRRTANKPTGQCGS